MDCVRPPGNEDSFPEIYERSVEVAEVAEKTGFDSAWIAEHHFTEDGYIASPFPLAGAIASRTSSLDVGLAIAPAPLYEPVRLAENAATVQNIASRGGGRFFLGLGLGYRDIEYEVYGVERRKRVGHLLDCVETCRGAWSDGAFELDGRLYSYPEVDVTPKPTPGIRLCIGALSEPGITRAASIADGFVMGAGFDIDMIKEKLDLLGDALASHDRSMEKFQVYAIQYAFVHPDGRDVAWDAVRDAYLYNRKAHLHYLSNSADFDLNLTPTEIENRAPALEPEWRSQLRHGTPSEVHEELAEIDSAVDGDVHFILQFTQPGLDRQKVLDATELFGTEVVATPP